MNHAIPYFLTILCLSHCSHKPQTQLLDVTDYDANWGKKLATEATNAADRKACTADSSFSCVGIALERALGFVPQWGELNTDLCPRSFSDFWKPEVHEKMLHLRKIAVTDAAILSQAPVGSLIVRAACDNYKLCGAKYDGAGTISVKIDNNGNTAAASVGEEKCRQAPLLAIFVPIKL